MNAYDRLTHAIMRARTHGWVQGKVFTEDGDCFWGLLHTPEERAIMNNLRGELENADQVARESLDAITIACVACGFHGNPLKHMTPIQDAIIWNDWAGRTFEEVIAKLEYGRDRLLHDQADAVRDGRPTTLDLEIQQGLDCAHGRRALMAVKPMFVGELGCVPKNTMVGMFALASE